MLTSTIEISLKGKDSFDVNAIPENLIAAIPQHHRTGIAKTANTDTLLEVYPAGAEGAACASCIPKQTTQRQRAFTPEKSAWVEEDLRFQVLSFRGDCD